MMRQAPKPAGTETAMDFMTPTAFDILVISNIAVGLVLAGRRLVKDIRAPLPDEAPDWARAAYDSAAKAAASTTDSQHQARLQSGHRN